MKRMAFALVFPLLLTGAAIAQQDAGNFTLIIKGGKKDYQYVPVCVPLSLPRDLADNNQKSGSQALLKNGKERFIGQLTAPGLTTENIQPKQKGLVRRDLHFVLSEVHANQTVTLECEICSNKTADVPGFVWQEAKGGKEILGFQAEGGSIRFVLQYMGQPYDPSTAESRNRTYKVFHHLFDPDGKRHVTNGGHNDLDKETPQTAKKLLYPHHRGLMFGFNRITYNKNKRADTWHCRGDDYTEHVKTLSREAGPVLGRHRVLIDWHGSDKEVFAKEEREMTVYNVPGGTLVEFASRLKTTGGTVKLDGDPQHAGFQFRAANQVATKTRNQTYYLRVDGKGKPGQTINWNSKNPPKGTVDVPWKAMSFVLDNQRYTVAYLDHTQNSGEARHSERDYGRFGYYFEYELTEQNPLLVNYRIWLQEGEMEGSEVEELAAEFVSPPHVTVK